MFFLKYRIVSFNIKCDDTIAELKEELLWKNRKHNLVDEILDLNADIIGMQEVMLHQFDYFNDGLKSEYQSIYCSRDENATNEQIYLQTVRPMIEAAFHKTKVTCFAYGQTGSGKTFTIANILSGNIFNRVVFNFIICNNYICFGEFF